MLCETNADKDTVFINHIHTIKTLALNKTFLVSFQMQGSDTDLPYFLFYLFIYLFFKILPMREKKLDQLFSWEIVISSVKKNGLLCYMKYLLCHTFKKGRQR